MGTRLCALVILLTPRLAAASDVQLWTEAGVRAELTDQLRLQLDQHLRFDQDVSATDSIMPELVLSLRPVKFLRLALGYRFIAEPIDTAAETYIESWHRVFADVRLRYRFKPITVRYRLRLQEQFGFPWANGEELSAKHTIRNKIQVELDVGAEPFVFVELFNRLDDADGPWHKWRLGAGVSGTIDGHELTVSYRMERSLTHARETRHIVAMGYHFGFRDPLF